MADADDLAEIAMGVPGGDGGSRQRAKARLRWGINLASFLSGVGIAGFFAGVAWSNFRRDIDFVQTQLAGIRATLDVKLEPVVTRVAEHEIRIGALEHTLGQCCPAGRTSSLLFPCPLPIGALARR